MSDQVLSFAESMSIPRWYAAHVRSRHEKKIADQFLGRNINCYLPLYETERRWTDRIAKVELPLFSCYIFVQIPISEKLRVLEVPGVLQLVSTAGQPVPLADSEIESLRNGLTSDVLAEPHPYLQVGTRVRVKSGALSGVEGFLIRKKDNYRLVISVDLIMRSIAVEISAVDVEPV